jgi:hypothetical protein
MQVREHVADVIILKNREDIKRFEEIAASFT